MSDCVPRVFDVTQLVPVTTRVMAQDEDDARNVAVRFPVQLMPGGADVLAVTVGFSESIEVKEVANE
jgi:hypothetical protein